MREREAVRRHGLAASQGAAEGLPLESSASGLCTRALYRPLVGVASLTSEWGSTEAYAYDGAGRLSSSATPLGTSATYSYRVSHDGSSGRPSAAPCEAASPWRRTASA